MLYDASYNGGIGLENAWNATKQGDFLGAGKAVGQQVLPNLGMGLLSLLPYTPFAVKTANGIAKVGRQIQPALRVNYLKLFEKDKTALDYHKARLASRGVNKNPLTFDISNEDEFRKFVDIINPTITESDKKVLFQQLQEISRREGGAHAIFIPGHAEGIIIYNKTLPHIKHNLPQILSHEYDHVYNIPKEPLSGFDVDKLPKAMQQYFTHKNGTEFSARGSQIKDYYGLTKETQKITPAQLEYAKNHYISDGYFNNNMTEFFNSITDYKKAANWINKNSSIVILPLMLNEDDKKVIE